MAYKIVIDSGHGGSDPGATYNGRQEKDDNLRLAMAVGNILSQNGVDVAYTRTSDMYHTPFEKAQIANEADGDFFMPCAVVAADARAASAHFFASENKKNTVLLFYNI